MNPDHGWDALLNPGRAETWFELEPRPAFAPGATCYHPANAWWLAELCRLVYREGGHEDRAGAEDRTRGAILQDVGLRELDFFHEGATQCALVRPRADAGEDFAVLVFRGTSQVRDWVTNLRAIPTDWPAGGRVHRGFRRALAKVWDLVEPRLAALGCPLFYTGHSLGGALATLAASRLAPRSLYTFGSPRVGDRGFAQTLADTPAFRIVNHRDVVPRVPPETEGLGFTHVGDLHYISSGRQLVVDPADEFVSQDRGAKNGGSAEDRRRWFDPAGPLSDHAPINYVAHLAGFVGTT